MIIPVSWHSSWNAFMNDENVILALLKIENKLKEQKIFPEAENVLRFLQKDLSDVKYIIVGMEPYPSSYDKNGKQIPEATGRSFEVSSITTWTQKFKQSSLRNILKTIYVNEYNKKETMENIRKLIENGSFPIKQPKEWFDSLEKQGIMFLNATLTVKPYNVDSHTELWTNFMNLLIEYIRNLNENVRWLLWGQKAQDRILPLISEDEAICCCHPRLAEFVDFNCFQYTENINWLG